MIAQVCPSVNPSARIYYIFARNFYIKRLNHFSCGIGVKQGVRGSVRTGMLFAAISTGGSAMQLLPMLLSISPLAGSRESTTKSRLYGARAAAIRMTITSS